MAVTDVTAFRRGLAIVYNTDLAASGQIADYVCQKYGLPEVNKIGFAMGTGWRWAYSPSRYQDVFVRLHERLGIIGATGVLLCEGSPNRMDLPLELDPSDVTSNGVDTARMLAITRRIVAANSLVAYGEPRLQSNAATDRRPNYQYPRTGPWTISHSGKLAITGYWTRRGGGAYMAPDHEMREYDGYIDVGLDATMEAARGTFSGVAAGEREVARFTATFDGDFSRFHMLPYGRIGLPKLTADDTFDADLFAKSKAIIDRGAAFERRRSSVKDSRILFPFAAVGWSTSAYNVGKQALCYRKALDAGFTNLAYWYDDDVQSWDQTALTLAPVADGLNATDNWTRANLDAGMATGHVFDVAVGGGLKNGDTGAVTPSRATAWCTATNGFVPAATGAIIMGGASYTYQWVQRLAELDRLVAAVCSPYSNGGGHHITAQEAQTPTDVFLALLEGRSLMEAAALCTEDAHYPMGNPLVRPFAN